MPPLPSLQKGLSLSRWTGSRPTRPAGPLRVVVGAAAFAIAGGVLAQGAQGAPDASSEVVATFTGGAITRADLESVLTQKLPFERERLLKAGGVEEVLSNLIRYDLLVRAAQARGYRDDVRVRDAAQAKANDLLIGAVATVDPQAISDKEIARAFEERRRQFSRPPLRRASYVLLKMKSQAQALIEQLKGVDREHFARVASEQSQDPKTRNQGGELGYFDREGKTERGAPSPASPLLAAAAFKLHRVGDITPLPIALPKGFAVLMLTGQMPPVQTTAKAKEVNERLREQLAQSQSGAKLDAFLAALREKYHPVVHESLLDLVKLPPAEPAQIPSGFPAAPPDPREPLKVVEPDGY